MTNTDRSEQIETAARAIRDAVKISIRPNGGTMELLEQGHTFHLNQDESTKAARAAHDAFHPTITTVEAAEALPDGTVFLSKYADGFTMHPYLRGDMTFWGEVLPVTVLHMGGAA